MSFSVIILAAGQGKRMQSSLPKVLHPLAGKPLLTHLIEKVRALNPLSFSVVVGHGAEAVQAHYDEFSDIEWVLQAEQNGTGDAVRQALPHLPKQNHPVLILSGDAPLVAVETLQQLEALSSTCPLTLLTTRLQNPMGMGRIIRGPDLSVEEIVEEKDATAEQKLIHEINAGIYMVWRDLLADFLPVMSSNNQQNEFYLTDIVNFAVQRQQKIHAIEVLEAWQVMGVNTRAQLAQLERHWQLAQAKQLLAAGVTLFDPARLDIRGHAQVGQDVILDINVILEGEVIIEPGAYIGPNTRIKDSYIGPGVRVEANSVIEGARVAADCVVGPFARLRPGTVLENGARIGNFVETKKAYIGQRSKVNHLSYIGDAKVGAEVNIGAGTITCNYDGANKHQTVIEDYVFIGSDTQLVAPVTVEKGATIAAGTTVIRDVCAKALILNPKSQKSITDWQRPEKKVESTKE